MKKNNVISVRIDDETLQLWHYLKSIRVNPAAILQLATKEALKTKAADMNYNNDIEKLPF